jgi:Mg-chelatase subunit ChlD
MSTFRRWAFWRRVYYGTGFIFTLTVITVGVYFGYFYTPGNCFDNSANADERGVDCGGSCVRICATDVILPRIVWAESFEIVEGQYNAVAYVENSNQVAATPELAYTLQLLSGTEVVAERKGKTVLPPNSVYPIFEGRIQTNGKKVTETKLTLEPPELWIPASAGREQFEVSNINLSGADVRPRLDVIIKNIELTAAEQVEVVATLFNDAGKPVTASQTFIDRLEQRSTKDIVFTWPNSIAKTVRSCVVPTDVVLAIDLSGSMNNDGASPPQPVTDALASAKSFAESLGKNDQAGVITFATGASTEQFLSRDHLKTASLINSLKISPVEETGYTNTGAGLIAAQSELNSERHSGDARRVVVLLTDGMPTAKDSNLDVVGETKTAAKELTADNIDVYAIGLGKGVDLDFISQIASDKDHAFYAPSTGDLDDIYKKITSSLCEVGTAKIEVIAKTPTNFAPLR